VNDADGSMGSVKDGRSWDEVACGGIDVEGDDRIGVLVGGEEEGVIF